jgi:hypothetical protein
MPSTSARILEQRGIVLTDQAGELGGEFGDSAVQLADAAQQLAADPDLGGCGGGAETARIADERLERAG